MLLGVAISTVENNVARALDLAKSIQSYGGDVRVISQGCANDEIRLNDGLVIVNRREFGLSQSRNIACELSDSQYVWFLDDDVFVSKQMYRALVVELEREMPDVLIGRISCSDSDGYYKNYEAKTYLRTLRALRASSIEIVVSTSFASKYKIRFNESLGLGSEFPSGEENCFLLDCISSGGRLLYSETTIVSHPCNEPHKSVFGEWSISGVPYSKGVVARRVGGGVGLILLIKWVVRALVVGVPPSKVLSAFRGFVDGP